MTSEWASVLVLLDCQDDSADPDPVTKGICKSLSSIMSKMKGRIIPASVYDKDILAAPSVDSWASMFVSGCFMRGERVIGAVSPWQETSLPLAIAIQKAAGLKLIATEDISLKHLQRQRLRANLGPEKFPWEFELVNLRDLSPELPMFADLEKGKKKVIKHPNGWGHFGFKVISCKDDVIEYSSTFKDCWSSRILKEQIFDFVICEDFVDGIEVVFDWFVGAPSGPILVGAWRNNSPDRGQPSWTLESLPGMSAARVEDLKLQSLETVKAMEISRGFLHCEYRIDSKTGKLFLLEINPRLSGAELVQVYSRSFGFELIGKMLYTIATGECSLEVETEIMAVVENQLRNPRIWFATITAPTKEELDSIVELKSKDLRTFECTEWRSNHKWAYAVLKGTPEDVLKDACLIEESIIGWKKET